MFLFVCCEAVESKLVKLETSGQSYKCSMVVNYDSRAVIYNRRAFIKAHSHQSQVAATVTKGPLQVAAKNWNIFYLATIYRRLQQICSVE